ncbi:MAG: hypothetical protein HYZ16_00890 [Bacteroidetes bacterium]|nr:hypothetical protein [Bacteroidota bacterium]
MAQLQVHRTLGMGKWTLAFLAFVPLVLTSCQTSKYTVTDGVYYNPLKDKNQLDETMGRGEPAYTVVDKRGETEITEPSNEPDTRPKVYTETDTTHYSGSNVVINNYNGDYYDFDDDYGYTRRINQFYYPSATSSYYSGWGMYGPGGVVVTNYYYDPWFYDPWFGPRVSYSYSYGYGYSHYTTWYAAPGYGCGYNAFNCGYNCYNPCGWGNCGSGYTGGCGSNRYYRGYRNGYNDGYWDGYNDGYYGYNNYYGDPRWNTNQPNSGFGPRSTVYNLGTTPDNGGRKDLPHRMAAPHTETATMHVDDHLVNRAKRAKNNDIGTTRSEPYITPYRSAVNGNDIGVSKPTVKSGTLPNRTDATNTRTTPTGTPPKEYTLATRNTVRGGSAPTNDYVVTIDGRNTISRHRETPSGTSNPSGRPVVTGGAPATRTKEEATIASPNTGSRPQAPQRTNTTTAPTNHRVSDTYRPSTPTRTIPKETGARMSKPSTPTGPSRPSGTVSPGTHRPSGRISSPSGSSRPTSASPSRSSTPTKPAGASPSRPSSGSKTLPKR